MYSVDCSQEQYCEDERCLSCPTGYCFSPEDDHYKVGCGDESYGPGLCKLCSGTLAGVFVGTILGFIGVFFLSCSCISKYKKSNRNTHQERTDPTVQDGNENNVNHNPSNLSILAHRRPTITPLFFAQSQTVTMTHNEAAGTESASVEGSDMTSTGDQPPSYEAMFPQGCVDVSEDVKDVDGLPSYDSIMR